MLKKSVLIVEDDKNIAQYMKNVLQKAGFEISGIIAFGEDAVEIVDSLNTNLVLMDINLAGETNGLKTAELISQNLDIPIIFVTANNDEETIRQAALANPYGYLLKPFNENDLKITVELAFYKYEHSLIQKKYNDHLESLHRTATRLHNSNSLEEVIDITAQTASKFCPYDRFALYKINYNELDYIRGSYKPSLDNCEFNFLKDLAVITYDHDAPVRMNYQEDSPLSVPENLSLQSCLSIRIGDLGVLQLVAEKNNAFHENDLRIIKLLLGHTYEAIKRVQLEQELRDQAIHDPLTNAYNRFYLYKILEKEKRLAKIKKRVVAFLMIDLNDLKKINDIYGHTIGDEVIKIVVSIISKEAGSQATIIRFGGDEFLVVISNPEFEIADLEKRIQERTAVWNRDINEYDFNISFAIGSVCWHSDSEQSIEDILGQVDEKMYENKKLMKNNQTVKA
ncbi:MAG: diguanylate cyclase [Candidatus Cloacimonetes bacterium]|nr:diguanylate cyclase [Candidatus Cloacimonadota bacterium]